MTPVILVNVGLTSTVSPDFKQLGDSEVKLDVIYYPKEVPCQSGRLIESFREPWDGDLSKCRRKEINEKTEIAVLKADLVSREYPLMIRSWNTGLPFEVGQYKGRRT